VTCQSPILFIVFNRPESTQRVFEQIRLARPSRLFVAADGVRAGRPGEREVCEQVRAIATNVDWPCDVTTLFRSENLGCKRAVQGAINWFFENVEQGIILEDDCVPVPSFFRYCDELLDRYAGDSSVAQICGSTFVPGAAGDDSYYFTHYADIWGWATWRRAWALSDVEMKDWPEWRDSGGLKRMHGNSPALTAIWQDIFDKTHSGQVDTWDYQWMYVCWKLNLKSIKPARMQIQNIGFDHNATHTGTLVPDYVTPAIELEFPLRHPKSQAVNPATERMIAELRYSIDRWTEAAHMAARVPVVGEGLIQLAKKVRNFGRGLAS